jgi:hypothetical protein
MNVGTNDVKYRGCGRVKFNRKIFPLSNKRIISFAFRISSVDKPEQKFRRCASGGALYCFTPVEAEAIMRCHFRNKSQVSPKEMNGLRSPARSRGKREDAQESKDSIRDAECRNARKY